MRRVLVVDDNPAVTSVLRRGLAYEGFAVDTASSGTEALAMARTQSPGLVILERTGVESAPTYNTRPPI